jgi:hypothetical protein
MLILTKAASARGAEAGEIALLAGALPADEESFPPSQPVKSKVSEVIAQ